MRSALAVLLFLFAACSAPRPAADRPPLLTVGAVPLEKRDVRQEQLEVFGRFLERKLGGRVAVQVATDYKDFSRSLSQKRWDLVMVGPVMYSRAHEVGYEALAMGFRDGAFVRRGVFFARADSAVKGVLDLKGKRVAFVSAHSAAGFQFPFAFLLAQGLGAADFQRDFLGSHDAVVKAVLEGRADGGATYDGGIPDLAGARAAELAVVGQTDPIPGEAFAMRADSPLLPRLREILLSLHSEPEAPQMLPLLHADKFVAPPPGVFDVARSIDLLVTEAAGL